MSVDRSLPADLVLRQARASDPVGSAWVSANAGSGKTFLLAQRVIRLLLSGADPGRILCLTFTKAAAAEMAKRVFQILAGWVTLPETDLAAEIKKIEGRSPNRDQVIAARRLFARALETPGGLKIQTIHSFCERVLHQFPFEANVAGHFQVMEADTANALMAGARAAVLTEAATEPDGALGSAYALLIETASDKEVFDTINAFVNERVALRRWIEDSGSQARAVRQLRAHFDLDAGETAAAIIAQIPFPDAFNQSYATRILPLLAGGAKTDQGVAERLRAALAAPGPALADTYLAIFFRTDKGSRLVPRALSRFVTKAMKGQIPDLEDRVAAEIDRLSALQQRLYAVRTVEMTAAMMCIADAVISTYEAEKAARGLLDFDDLIGRTATLLERSEAAPWVHYKLDYGLDHILVDEAQDTSPQQWRVILSLAEDFFAGASARPGTRTIFSVGDEKQSIYSFQGAEPRWFADMRRAFSRRTRDAQRAWHDVTLPLSFRSTPQVLAAVDLVFGDPMIARGVSESGIEPHQAIRGDEDGLVEIWPLVEPDDSALPDDWTVPLDRVQANSPPVRLADKIAGHIAAMIRAGETVTKDRRPITPGDILILVRKRTAFVSAMNRALKEAGLPVAGADRIDLLDHIAVLDLLAVADIALLPEDDLTLATVLKCPLIALDEDALFDLAHGRPGSLWAAVESHAESDQRFGDALGMLSEWRRRADFMPPFEFFARILGPDGGRQAFHRHFGVEADDVLDEFLDRALAFEQSEAVPSLQGFLAWLRGGLADIKREVDPERDEVRVMTVHGAKGLEAPIVFLVDTGSAPVHASHRPKMLSLSQNGGVADGGPLIWARGTTATQEQERAMEGALARIDDEYRRLLYVGMTRARDRLYLCGHRSKRQLPETCWYGLIERILVPAARPMVDTEGAPICWRLGADPVAEKVTERHDESQATDYPPWLFQGARPAAAARPLYPSVDAEMHTGAATIADAGADRRLYGDLVHRLLQVLPDVDPAERRDIGSRIGKSYGDDLDAALIGDALAEAIAVIDTPGLAWLFGAGSRAEVAVFGSIEAAGRTRPIAGRIDRLVIGDDAVHIVDFKSDRQPPIAVEAAPPAYIRQLAHYRRVLCDTFSEKTIHAGLVWTKSATYMAVPPALMDAAVDRLIP